MGLAATYYRFNGRPQPTQSIEDSKLMNFSNKELYNASKASETAQQSDMVFISGKSSEDIEKALEDAISNNNSLIDNITSQLDKIFGKNDKDSSGVGDKSQEKTINELKAEYEKLMAKKEELEKQLEEVKNTKISGMISSSAKISQMMKKTADIARITKELEEVTAKAEALKAEIEAREAEENKGSDSSSAVQDTQDTTETTETTGTESTKEQTVEEKIQEIKNKIEALKAEMAELAKQNKFEMARSHMGFPYMKCVTPEINNKITMIQMQISNLQMEIIKLENSDMFNDNDVNTSTDVSLSDIKSREAEFEADQESIEAEKARIEELIQHNMNNTGFWLLGQ